MRGGWQDLQQEETGDTRGPSPCQRSGAVGSSFFAFGKCFARMMSTGRAFVESSGVGALVVTRRLQRQSARSQVVNALTPRTVNAVASSNGHSKRSIPKSFVWPSGPRQFEADKVRTLSRPPLCNRVHMVAIQLRRRLISEVRFSPALDLTIWFAWQEALLYYIDEENREGILAGILSRGLVDVKRHSNVRSFSWSHLRSAPATLPNELSTMRAEHALSAMLPYDAAVWQAPALRGCREGPRQLRSAPTRRRAHRRQDGLRA